MYHILINPASRSGKGSRIWKEQIEPALQRGNIDYQAHFSKKAGDVARLTTQIINNADSCPVHLILLGGDGTLDEALQGVFDFTKVVFGYIPTGSSNDFARDLGIPFDPLAALDRILHSGQEHKMDLGTVTYEDGEHRHFAVSCGIGYDAAICAEALHSKMKVLFNKIGLGKLTYLGIALKQLVHAKKNRSTLTIGNEEPIIIENMFFIASMIHRYEGGGFKFCPNADDSDGLLDLCVVGDIAKPLILLALPTAFKGKHYRFNGITAYQTDRLTIQTSSPLWVHTDGEVTRKSSKITLNCTKKALTFIC